MLAIAYEIERKPEGVKSYILSSTLSETKVWADEQHRMIERDLSDDEILAILTAEETGDYSTEEYIQANDHYMKLHCAEVTEDSPECIKREKKSGSECYLTAWGPNEYTPTGTLKDYNYTARMNEFRSPACIMHGDSDLCTDAVVKTMAQNLPTHEIHTFSPARHMPFAECREEYISILNAWLESHD